MPWPGVMPRWEWPAEIVGLEWDSSGEQFWGGGFTQQLMGLPCVGDGEGGAGIHPTWPG